MRLGRGAITVFVSAVLLAEGISARPHPADSGIYGPCPAGSGIYDPHPADSGIYDPRPADSRPAVLRSAETQSAGPRTAGVVFSFCRTGIEYGHTLNEKAFWNIGIGVEYGSAVFYRNLTPGVSLDFVYNYVLRSWKSEAGEGVFYAGPGLKAGYISDRKENSGLTLGLIGNLGFDFRFKLPVTLSVAIKPVLGLYLRGEDNNFSLGLYRNGLILGLTPEIGIKYSF